MNNFDQNPTSENSGRRPAGGHELPTLGGVDACFLFSTPPVRQCHYCMLGSSGPLLAARLRMLAGRLSRLLTREALSWRTVTLSRATKAELRTALFDGTEKKVGATQPPLHDSATCAVVRKRRPSRRVVRATQTAPSGPTAMAAVCGAQHKSRDWASRPRTARGS